MENDVGGVPWYTVASVRMNNLVRSEVLNVELLGLLGPVDGEEGCSIVEVVALAVHKAGSTNEAAETQGKEDGREVSPRGESGFRSGWEI